MNDRARERGASWRRHQLLRLTFVETDRSMRICGIHAHKELYVVEAFVAVDGTLGVVVGSWPRVSVPSYSHPISILSTGGGGNSSCQLTSTNRRTFVSRRMADGRKSSQLLLSQVLVSHRAPTSLASGTTSWKIGYCSDSSKSAHRVGVMLECLHVDMLP